MPIFQYEYSDVFGRFFGPYKEKYTSKEELFDYLKLSKKNLLSLYEIKEDNTKDVIIPLASSVETPVKTVNKYIVLDLELEFDTATVRELRKTKVMLLFSRQENTLDLYMQPQTPILSETGLPIYGFLKIDRGALSLANYSRILDAIAIEYFSAFESLD